MEGTGMVKVLEELLMPFGITSLTKLFLKSYIYILSFVHDFSAQGQYTNDISQWWDNAQAKVSPLPT